MFCVFKDDLDLPEDLDFPLEHTDMLSFGACADTSVIEVLLVIKLPTSASTCSKIDATS
jgi:hypothetical protein